MTFEHRQRLIDEEINFLQPRLASFVKSRGDDLRGEQSWSYYAYSFGHAFEVLWDAATARRGHSLLWQPLLMVCRQSVELSLKAGLADVGPPGYKPCAHHGLEDLWHELLSALTKVGFSTDDEFSSSVAEVVSILHRHDPKGDRFRYPTSRIGNTFPATVVELEELFKAHWRLTTYCEAIGDMLAEGYREY
jgi:hypothetical protein